MNIVRYPTEKLVSLLHDQKVATMPQLKAALGTSGVGVRTEYLVFPC